MTSPEEDEELKKEAGELLDMVKSYESLVGHNNPRPNREVRRAQKKRNRQLLKKDRRGNL